MVGRRVYFSCCRAMVFWILEVFEAMMWFAKVSGSSGLQLWFRETSFGNGGRRD